ncbi:MAG: diguanylate cyclase [Candidatus Saccharimonadales bacterium]
MAEAFYDPTKTFDDNFDDGPAEVAGAAAALKTAAASSGKPAFKAFGKLVNSPFGIPAGPLPNSQYVKYAFEHGFDVVCYKTQRSIEFGCNEFPNVLYLDVDGDLTLEKAAQPQLGLTKTSKSPKDLSITNSFGNPSRGPDYWVPDLRKAIGYQGPGQLLMMSVVGSVQDGFSEQDYWDDFAHAAELAASTGVGAIEVNLSCPNVATEGVLCYTHDAVVEICKRVKARIGDTPLIAKFGYFAPQQQALLEQIITDSAPYLAGVSAINTIAAPVVDKDGQQALPGPNRLKSGVCGASIKWAGLDMVERLAKLRAKRSLDFQIIGVGGVMTPADFAAYCQAGADIVMSATGSMWNPGLANQVKASLASH